MKIILVGGYADGAEHEIPNDGRDQVYVPVEPSIHAFHSPASYEDISRPTILIYRRIGRTNKFKFHSEQ